MPWRFLSLGYLSISTDVNQNAAPGSTLFITLKQYISTDKYYSKGALCSDRDNVTGHTTKEQILQVLHLIW